MFCWEWAFLRKLPFLFFRFFFESECFCGNCLFCFRPFFFCFSFFTCVQVGVSARFCRNCLFCFCPFFSVFPFFLPVFSWKWAFLRKLPNLFLSVFSVFFLPVFSVSVFAETAFSVFVLFFSFSVFFYLCSAESERFCGNRSKKENAGYKLQHAWKTKKIIRKFSRHKQIRCMKM